MNEEVNMYIVICTSSKVMGLIGVQVYFFSQGNNVHIFSFATKKADKVECYDLGSYQQFLLGISSSA